MSRWEGRSRVRYADWDDTRCASCNGVIMTGDQITVKSGWTYHLRCSPGGDDE